MSQSSIFSLLKRIRLKRLKMLDWIFTFCDTFNMFKQRFDNGKKLTNH